MSHDQFIISWRLTGTEMGREAGRRTSRASTRQYLLRSIRHFTPYTLFNRAPPASAPMLASASL
ncbi:hypothetical protein K1T71_005578 [Dendrolimus kikuchii]|uniref:Uncharacterized protein n=1 Tax=Dendrolimus kikuchii TaxID=765133 RepID=A0ACC1D4I3_9NEOP|nr:hypothetical protein K1T71_005578 [Dendrolimus kikuchii]